MATPRLRSAPIHGALLRYVDEGAGPPVVFVHGAMGDLRVWEGQREAVAARYRYLALDQRHFGTGDWPDGAPSYSLATHVDDLAAFIAHVGAAPAHVVGWSYGGAVALALAVRHPAAVRSLFLNEPALMSIEDGDDARRRLRDERSQLGPAMAASDAGDALEATRRFADWVDADPGGFDRMPPAQRAVFEDNARTVALHFASPAGAPIGCADLGRIDIPVEVTVGGLTRPFFRILAEAACRCIRGARLTVLDGRRHLAPLEDPPSFNRALLRFLDAR